MAGWLKVSFAVSGGITLAGLLAMVGAGVGDAYTEAGKFSAVFYTGFLGLMIGAGLLYSGRKDH